MLGWVAFALLVVTAEVAAAAAAVPELDFSASDTVVVIVVEEVVLGSAAATAAAVVEVLIVLLAAAIGNGTNKCALDKKTSLPMPVPAYFLEIRMGAQCNFPDRYARSVVPFSQSVK